MQKHLIQFGWSWQGHRAIERVAIEGLSPKDANLKHFLKQHLEPLHQHSIHEDKHPNNMPLKTVKMIRPYILPKWMDSCQISEM